MLSPDTQKILELSIIYDRENADIGRQIGLSETSVSKKRAEAIRRIKEHMATEQ